MLCVFEYWWVESNTEELARYSPTHTQNFFLSSDIGARFERDAFDTLFDHAPDKLNVVKKVCHAVFMAPYSVYKSLCLFVYASLT